MKYKLIIFFIFFVSTFLIVNSLLMKAHGAGYMKPKNQINHNILEGYIIYTGSPKAGESPCKAMYLSNKNKADLKHPFDAIEQERMEQLKKIIGDKSAIYFPSFSNDKSKVVFLITKGTIIRPQINSLVGTLCIMDFKNDTGINEIVNNLPIDYFNAPNWSPDEIEIVFRKNEKEIYIYNLLDGKFRKICDGLMPIWNPVDKTELVFVGVKKPNIIVKINPYTLIKKSSYKSEGSIESLAWSPDGNNIAIVEGLFKTIRLIVIDKDFKSKNIIGILGFSNLTSNIIWKNNEKK